MCRTVLSCTGRHISVSTEWEELDGSCKNEKQIEVLRRRLAWAKLFFND